MANAEQSLKSARLYETGILPQARLAVESLLSAYRVNRVDFLTLLDNQMMVLNYEISRASALANHNKALAEIDLLPANPGPQSARRTNNQCVNARGENHEVVRNCSNRDRRGGSRR